MSDGNKVFELLRKPRKKWQELPDRKKRWIKAGISGVILLLGVLLVLSVWSGFKTPEGSIRKKLLLFFVSSFALWGASIHVKNPLNKFANTVINVFLAVLLPIFMFVSMQLFMGVEAEQLLDMKLLRVLLNIVILFLIEGVVYGLTLNIRLALSVMAGASTLFTVTNLYLIRFRQIPLLYSDLSVLGTAGNVAENYDYSPDVTILTCLLIFLDIVVLSRKLEKHKDTIKKTWIARSVITVLVSVCCVRFCQVCVYTDYLQQNGIAVNNFRPIRAYLKSGGMLTFVRSIRLSMVEKPEGYSEERVEAIAERYSSDSSSGTGKKPNVIVVMNEAFSDLQSVGKFATSKPVMPVYDSLKENAIKGQAYVSVFGGKTANSEFEFLTGDTNAFLPAGATPYQIFLKDYVPSLTSTLKEQEYQGLLAMHPFLGNGYNRINVYNNLGFSDFITVDDFPEDAGKVRNFISDDTDVSRIIEEYEKVREKSEEPFYMFNVTMQNHSPYGTDFDNLPKEITIDTPNQKDAAAERYLNLIHLSDKALGKLVDYFKEKKDPTIIVFFGDHEPGLSDEFYSKLLGKKLDDLTDEESMEMYRVPYLIWANFKMESKENATSSLNYLKAQMMEAAGMNLTGYDRYLLDLKKEIPAITANGYFGADGHYYKINDKTSPYYQKVEEYRCMQYNHLFEKTDKSAIFELKEK